MNNMNDKDSMGMIHILINNDDNNDLANRSPLKMVKVFIGCCYVSRWKSTSRTMISSRHRITKE